MIKKLTKEQMKKLRTYKDRAIEEGLDLTPINVDKAVAAVMAYCNIQAPKVQVYDSPEAALKARKDLSISTAIFTSADIGWITHYDIFKTECGVDPSILSPFSQETMDVLPLLKNLYRNTHIFWASSEEIILVKRPVELCLIDTPTMLTDEASGVSRPLRILHSVDGPAIRYADGTGVYAICGIRLSDKYEYIVKDWNKLKPTDILQIDNVEVRQAAMSARGVGMLNDLPSKTIDRWSSKVGGEYDLKSIDFGGGNTRIYLSGYCPSKGDNFCEAVHPEARTCKQALNWRENNKLSDDYEEPEMRT